MSEYQRYEFMTIDRPLTKTQLDAVNKLSSHIEASSTHALIEYNWGDFKHDPIEVLYKFFDGFLYWANWGNPQLALRFPHGIIPANLITDYNFDEFVTFTKHSEPGFKCIFVVLPSSNACKSGSSPYQKHRSDGEREKYQLKEFSLSW